MAWIKKSVGDKKKKLLKKAKDLGLNVNADMSEYELEHRIAEAKEEPEPKVQKSTTRGEY